MNPAQVRLQSLIEEIRSQSPQTLAAWRLSNHELVQLLESFAATTTTSLAEETQSLFNAMNPILAKQEDESCLFPKVSPPTPHLSVVFGGKYSATPQSISELLVFHLVQSCPCPHVVTVSRSSISIQNLPSTVTHFQKQNLDQQQGGIQEFLDVLDYVMAQWENYTNLPLIIYFTLGQHNGDNPFRRNLQAAQNLAHALQKIKKTLRFRQDWKVVLTGTDATLPSTHPDGTWIVDDTTCCYIVPTYKIMEYNFTYAVSKLAQYYILADVVAEICNNTQTNWKPTILKLEQHIHKAGDNGNYIPDQAIVTMDELDSISTHVERLQNPHFQIAQGISICYTPLHALPWAKQAQSSTDPKTDILEQVVKRLKNAMSIEQAVNRHFGRHNKNFQDYT